MFADRLESISQKYPMMAGTSVKELADMLCTIIEGGIIMSRTLSQQKF